MAEARAMTAVREEALLEAVVGPKEILPREICGPTADSKRAVSAAEGREGEVEEKKGEEVLLGEGDSERMDSKMVEKMARSRSVMVE